MMGLAESGKTTIINVVHKGMDPQEALKKPYVATIDYEREEIVRGKKVVIFDSGGQLSFLDKLTKTELSDFYFRNVLGIIYVVDVNKIEKLSQSKYYLKIIAKRLKELSPKAPIAIFFHKMDLVAPESEQAVIRNVQKFFRTELDFSFHSYTTTVLNDTIFQSFNEFLYLVTGKEDEGETVESLCRTFLNNYQQQIKSLQLFTTKDRPLLDLDISGFSNLSHKYINETLDQVFNYLGETISQDSKSWFIEGEKDYFFIIYTENGLALYVQTHKNNLHLIEKDRHSFFDECSKLARNIVAIYK